MTRRGSVSPDVKTYFDEQSLRYLDERYVRPSCEQLSYQSRRRLALELLGSGPGRVIDIGSGPGVLTGDLLARGFMIHEVDIAFEMLRESRRRVRESRIPQRVSFIQARLPSLPFADASFDAATCIGVFAYLEDPAASLGEIRRILTRGGVLVMQVSNALCPTAHLHSFLRRSYRRLGAALGGQAYPHLRIPLAAVRLPALCHILEQQGFTVDTWAHYDFRPPLVEWVLPSVALAAAAWLQRFERSRIGWIAEGIVVKARAC